MLEPHINTKNPHPLISELWAEFKVPHFSGLTFGDGRMIEMSEHNQYIDNQIRHELRVIGETTIEQFQRSNSQFIELTPFVNRSYLNGSDAYAICGEGEMGNEGFVAVVSETGLVWVAFFAMSNPFYDVQVRGDEIEARTSYDAIWRFPVSRPWDLSITYQR